MCYRPSDKGVAIKVMQAPMEMASLSSLLLLQPELLLLIFSSLLMHFNPSDDWNPTTVLPLVCSMWREVRHGRMLMAVAEASPGFSLLRLSKTQDIHIHHHPLVCRSLELPRISDSHLATLIARCDHPASLQMVFNRVWQDFRGNRRTLDRTVSALLGEERRRAGEERRLTGFTEYYRAPIIRQLSWLLTLQTHRFHLPINLDDAHGLAKALNLFIDTRRGSRDRDLHPVLIAKLALLHDSVGDKADPTIIKHIIEYVRCSVNEPMHTGFLAFLQTLDCFRLGNGVPLGAYCLFFPLVHSFAAGKLQLSQFLVHCGYDLDPVIQEMELDEDPTEFQLDFLKVLRHLDAIMKQHNPAQYNPMTLLACPGILHAAEYSFIFFRWSLNIGIFRATLEEAEALVSSAHASALHRWFQDIDSFNTWSYGYT